METGLKAFFYDYRYYLLPDGCESVEDVKKLAFTEVKRLKEEKCMAPNFVYGCEETELLKIEAPGRIFETTVNLYSEEEYNGILKKQVDKRCPGCLRYIDDGKPELNGHHREISLEGVCYSRETEREPAPFSSWAQWFWANIAENLDGLAKKIDSGDQRGVARFSIAGCSAFFCRWRYTAE